MPPPNDRTRYEALLEQLFSSYRARMMRLCRKADLTPPQFWALSTLKHHGRTKMSPLADFLGLSMGATSTLIDRLVGHGLVARESDPGDRRSVYALLTEKGTQVLEEASGARRAVTMRVFEHLAESDRAQLLAGLEALLSTWKTLNLDDEP
jgi:MarR family 2-MHQ and catechol resistance regulon transcriptional repressor